MFEAQKIFEPIYVVRAPFFSWLNQDDTIMTFYPGGKEGILDQDQETSFFNQGKSLLGAAMEILQSVMAFSNKPAIPNS